MNFPVNIEDQKKISLLKSLQAGATRVLYIPKGLYLYSALSIVIDACFYAQQSITFRLVARFLD